MVSPSIHWPSRFSGMAVRPVNQSGLGATIAATESNACWSLAVTRALDLPTMDVAGQTLIKRLALVIDDALITKVFYPVFPPDRNASEVLDWLKDALGKYNIVVE